jgi:hypothetical protein
MCLKPKFKKFNWLVKLITFNWPLAITLSPFGIYVNQKYKTVENVSERTKNHEMIHWGQQLELLIIIFYILYGIEWFIKLFIYGSESYRNISFEREAYDNDNNLNYKRKHYASFKRIIK